MDSLKFFASILLLSSFASSICIPGTESCNGIRNAFCDQEGSCVCRPGYEFKSREDGSICARADFELSFALGSECPMTDETACSGVAHSVCRKGRCVCSSGFIEDEHQCKPAPGDSGLKSACADGESPCGGLPNTKCVKGLCTCLDSFKAIFGRCYPGLGQRCSQAFACAASNSICSGTAQDQYRICVCQLGYFERDGECLPGIGSPCFRSLLFGGGCEVANSYCNASNLCDCEPGFQQAPRTPSTCVQVGTRTFLAATEMPSAGREWNDYTP